MKITFTKGFYVKKGSSIEVYNGDRKERGDEQDTDADEVFCSGFSDEESSTFKIEFSEEKKAEKEMKKPRYDFMTAEEARERYVDNIKNKRLEITHKINQLIVSACSEFRRSASFSYSGTDAEENLFSDVIEELKKRGFYISGVDRQGKRITIGW